MKDKKLSNTNVERIESLQVIRAIAFLGVFLNHAVRAFPGEGALYNCLAKSSGRWGVSVFFVLSGFLMTYSYWNRPLQNSFKGSVLFSIKKIRKLYPLHLLMLFFGVVYLMLQGETIIGVLKRLAVTIPLIQTWFPVGYQAINSVAWYLSVCVFLYFCFPFLLKHIKKNEKTWISLVAISLVFLFQLLIGFCVYQYTSIDIKWITYCHPIFRLGDFAIGVFLASIYFNRKIVIMSEQPISKLLGSLLEIIAIALNVIVCVYNANAPENTIWFTYTSLFIPSTVLLIFVFSLNIGIVSELLSNKLTFWLAAISPYAFLIHRLVINYFHSFTKHIIHYDHVSLLLITISFVITVIAVYIYQYLEKAVMLMISKRIKDTCE